MSIEDLSKILDDKLSKLDSKLDEALSKYGNVEKRLSTCESDIGHLLQRERGNNLRIIGLKIPTSPSPNVLTTADSVYKTLLEPIFQLALAEKILPVVPSLLESIDACHTIHTKKPEEIPPVHCRLRSKLLRDIIFTFKSRFFKANKLQYSIYEDLTPATRSLLRTTKERDDVESAWTRNGRVKFKLKSSQVIQTARSF